VDDDADGLADFPADPGCTDAADDSERDPALVCDDGADNDGDGQVDHPADPDCASPSDDAEEHVPACANGVDDDGDLRADAPSDPGCASASDDSERESTLACDDGLDDDGDGFVDHPADPGCGHPSDDSEGNAPACSNGVDDDGDGLVDHPADPQCTSASDLSETTAVRWTRNGHYYDLSTNALTWTNALAAAAQPVPPAGYQPGHLLSLSDADESAFVVASFGPGGGWIGFTDRLVEGEWRWIDATPGTWQDPDVFASPIQTAYTNWVRGEPNDFGGDEDFVEFPVNVWERWNDGGNVARRYFIEWEPIPGPACDNGVDDDGDGVADFPADPGCASASDESETDPGLACDNALDDDGDGRADHPADPGCASPSDDSERDPALACDDDLDEDADGVADYPADPGCANPSDDSEHNPVVDCDNGLDDDGDGLADFPADPGCPSPLAAPEDPICDDGLDNDGDGEIDLDDPVCNPAWPYWESAPCGLGAELLLALWSISWLRRRKRSPAKSASPSRAMRVSTGARRHGSYASRHD
jgi:hypothetical protein